MKARYDELIPARAALAKMEDKPLPVKSSLAVARLAHKLDDEIKTFASVREGLRKKYNIEFKTGTDGNTEFVSSKKENIDKFTSEFEELLGQEVEIIFDKINLPDSLEIEPSILMALDKFVNIKE